MGCSDTVLFFLFGGPLHFFCLWFLEGDLGDRVGDGRGTEEGESFFSWPDISLRIQYTPVLYSSVLFTIFFFGLSRSFFALIFSYMILEGGMGAGRVLWGLFNFRYRTRFSFGWAIIFFYLWFCHRFLEGGLGGLGW